MLRLLIILAIATQTAHGNALTYHLDKLYQLKQVSGGGADGTLDFVYDDNGNCTEKKLSGAVVTPSIVLRYSNASASAKQCSLIFDGQAGGTLSLPPTGGAQVYAAIPVSAALSQSIELKIVDTDFAANGAVDLRVDALIVSKGPKAYTFEAESAQLIGVTSDFDDTASGEMAVTDFGHAVMRFS